MNKKVLRKTLVDYIFLCVVLLGTLYILLNSSIEKQTNILVYITFIINFIFIIINLIKETKLGYCIDDMLWIFMLTFMVIAPVLQYLHNKFPWGDSILINDTIVIKSNLAILLFSVTYVLFKIYYNSYIKNIHKKSKYFTFDNMKTILNLSFIISILCSIYLIYKTGFINLFSRSTNSAHLENSALSLIVGNSFRAFPIITFTIHYIYKDINKRFYSKIQILIIAILGILVNFPTGLPRFQMAAIYLGVILIFKKNFENKYIFKYLILFGLLFIFPIINIFRYNTFSDIININISLPNPTEDFLKGDFDSYSMLARSLIYILGQGITWGKQLLGNVLFFIPRNIWSNKPVGTGAFLGESFGWNFTNVSCPYIGEGIINFGWIGIVIFSLILSYTISKLNYKYENIIKRKYNKVTCIRIIYPFIIGFIFFIMRGDLLSSVSFTIGFCFPCILLLIIDKVLSFVKKVKI